MNQTHRDDILKLAALLAVECLDVETAAAADTVKEATKETILTLALTTRPLMVSTGEGVSAIWKTFREDKLVTDDVVHALLAAATLHLTRLKLMDVNVEGMVEKIVASFSMVTEENTVVDAAIVERAYGKSVDPFVKGNYWFVYLYLLQLGSKWALSTSGSKGKP